MSTARRSVSSGSPFEPRIGFSRAVRVGDVVAVSGTAPIDADGRIVGAGDLYRQTVRCLDLIQEAVEATGLTLDNVVRTRVLLTDLSRWEEAARRHRRPVHRHPTGLDVRPGRWSARPRVAGRDRGRRGGRPELTEPTAR